jgi:hypothetical protein
MTAFFTYLKLGPSVATASIILLCGCQQQGGSGPQMGQLIGGATKQMTVDAPVGGFLPNPELLTNGNPGQTSLVYISPDLRPSSYSSVMIDPVTIWAGTDSSLNGVSPEQRQALADTFTADLGNALQAVCPITTQAGPGTFRVRFALVDAFQPNPVVNTVATYTPYASTAYGAASLLFNHGVGYFAGTATAEAYGVDAGSGTVVWEAVDKRGGTTALAENTLNTWLDVHHAFQAWSNVMAQRMTQMGFCPKRT